MTLRAGDCLEPAFTTARLRVWRVTIRPCPEHMDRAHFLACRTDIDWPAVACHATVWTQGPWTLPYLEWIETCRDMGRLGFASELWLGIEEHLGTPLCAIATTAGGRRLLRKLRRTAEPAYREYATADGGA